jgi:hypothetical protein
MTRKIETTTLFRPVGKQEMELIRQSGFRKFPPRLPSQPIFYPVLNQKYAEEISQKWNTKDPASGSMGFVTRFQVRSSFLRSYSIHTVGNSHHQEYWIPADKLPEFNQNIVGLIEIAGEFHGMKGK